MNLNWLAILKLVLPLAEDVVPIFIHNPESKQIEGVVVTTLNGLLQLNAAPPALPATATVTIKAA